LEIPIILPGILLFRASVVAKKAAWGPPNPIGTPNRYEFPKTMSAPYSFGVFVSVNASKSEATILMIF
jgi:hypothetical protein